MNSRTLISLALAFACLISGLGMCRALQDGGTFVRLDPPAVWR